jgi:hypothetical protein
MLKRLFSILTFFLLMSNVTFAQFRKYSNEFLNIGVGARTLAMSGSQVASIDDVTSGYWNPAGLMQFDDQLQAAAMHDEYFAGVATFDYITIAVPVDDGKRRLGASLIRLGVDNIANTLFLVQPDGSINYNNVTSFSAADYALLLSYAQSLPIDSLFVGGNAKIIHRIVGSFANSWGFGFDLGAQYHLNGFLFGLEARDVTTTFNAWSFSFTDQEKQVLENTDNIIPQSSIEITAPQVILGGGYKYAFNDNLALLGELDANLTTDGPRNVLIPGRPVSVDPHAGFELGYRGTVFLRVGAGGFQRATDDTGDGKNILIWQPTAGIGLHYKIVSLDYAFTKMVNFGGDVFSNVFSLRINLSKGSSF